MKVGTIHEFSLQIIVFFPNILLKKFPPRPISSEEELLATQTVIDSLIDQSELTSNEQDYLNVLGTLVYDY